MGPGTGGLPSAFFRPAPKSGAAAAARVPGRPAPPWASVGGPWPGLRGRRGTRTAGPDGKGWGGWRGSGIYDGGGPSAGADGGGRAWIYDWHRLGGGGG